MTVSGITKVPFFNRTTLAAMLDLPESSVVMKVADAGGGFGVRGEFYPGRLSDPVHRAQAQPPGQMGRGSARAFPRDQPFARDDLRSRDRLRPQRHHPGAARRGHDRHRRLCARHRRHVADAVCPIPAGALPDPELRLHGQCSRLQQNAIGDLPRPGTRRGQFLSRTIDRHRGGRSRHRSGRYPAAQFRHRAGDALRHRQAGELRAAGAIRFRRFRRRCSSRR